MSLRSTTRVPAAAIAAICLTMAASSTSCEDEKHSYVANMGDPHLTPTMVTTDVSTLISDSGYTRYHITTPVWRMYEDLDSPFWKFPEGLELEQYDNNMQPAARMRCDSAIYFERARLWQLDGHVVMVNTARDTFLTPQLFWDQPRAQVYSDSFMHITRADHIIEGFGFRSNQNMTAYTVNRPTAIIPVSARQNGADANRNGEPDSTARIDRSGRRMAPEPASQREDRVRTYRLR